MHSVSNCLPPQTPVHPLAYIRGYRSSPGTSGDRSSQASSPVLLVTSMCKASQSCAVVPRLTAASVSSLGSTEWPGQQSWWRDLPYSRHSSCHCHFIFSLEPFNLHICFQVYILSALEYNLFESRPLLYVIHCHIPKD